MHSNLNFILAKEACQFVRISPQMRYPIKFSKFESKPKHAYLNKTKNFKQLLTAVWWWNNFLDFTSVYSQQGNKANKVLLLINHTTKLFIIAFHQTFSCLKSALITLGKGVKYVQSQQWRQQNDVNDVVLVSLLVSSS